MSISEQTVRSIFAGLERGDGDAFFAHVADDVDWTVMGTHPLAGHYPSKGAFKEATFSKLGKVLPDGAELRVTDGDHRGRHGCGRARVRRHRAKRDAFRQPLLLGYSFRWGHHSRGARLPRLGDGRRAVPPEPGVSACQSQSG